MQLSKLQLLGFKSFADEVTLEFGQGITAVVGPNGSGKSNIVDAMLWTLGERSAKALRGHASTDVIFNGAASRPPTGLAEVSLFFDNADGVLPINFKEVQVTRRLFRDGGSEYALCGSKCRLRDITDLFLDTGIGPDAGCIISQGEIDAILSAKPEDRRGLIEGAAGVQKYHSRRVETRRRLDKVEVDLLRVRDITSELSAQIEPLREQAEVARQYDSLATRLRELQLQLLSYDYTTRREKLSEFETLRMESLHRVDEAGVRLGNLERLESAVGQRLRELEVEVETLSNALTEAVSRLGATEGQLAVVGERRRALAEQRDWGAKEIAAARARMETLGEEIEAARAALEKAQTENGAAAQIVESSERTLAEATARLADAARALQGLQTRQIAALRAGQARREQIAGTRAQAHALEERTRELEKLLVSSNDEAHALQRSLEEARALLEAERERFADASELEAARERLQTARLEAKSAGETLRGARETRARMQSRAGALRELEESLEGIAGGARAVLEAVRRGDLRDEYTLVADALRAPADLETAIEVALGAAVNNLICPQPDAARAAVDFLKRRRAGRATFLPLSTLRPSFLNERTLRVLDDPNVRGVAADLVECDAQFDDAIGYLLNRVLVVDTLEDAVRLAPRCDGARLVTLEGELVLPGGAITGGQGKSKSGGLLARKRELDEMESRLQALETEVEAAQKVLEASQNEIAGAEDALRDANEAHSLRQSAVARQEREVETLERDTRRLEQQRKAVEEQLKRVESQLEATRGARDEDDRAAQSAETEAHDLEHAIEAARATVTLATSERDARASEVADVRAQFGALGERLSALRRGVADLERARDEAQTQIQARQSQIERSAGEEVAIEQNEVEARITLAEIGAQRVDLETRLAAARQSRAEALERTHTAGADLKAARGALHAGEDELHRAEVKIASLETEVAELARRLSEEFDVQFSATGKIEGRRQRVEAVEGAPNAASSERAETESLPNETSSPDENALVPTIVVAIALPDADSFDRRAVASEIADLSRKIGALGGVNLGAVAQFDALSERLSFLDEQATDLETARAELLDVIAEVDGRIREQFLTTFSAIQSAFAQTFERVFGGGKTHLALTDPENLLETGIELRVQMPGKAAQDISLLSGGERALTALSFLLAILKVRPAPFAILDEVDAPLDQSNIGRFVDLLRDFTDTTQFIVITHNNGTMQAADALYGVTQQESGISTLMSVRLTDELVHEKAADELVVASS